MTEQKSSTGVPEQPIIQPTQFDPEDEYRPEPEPEPLPPSWMDGSLRIGIHTSIAKSYLDALESARKLGCNALQIFSASPRMWQGGSARIPEVDAQAFRARRDELRLGPLVIHANYLINLASEQRMLQTRSIQAFHDEIVRAMALGADFLVVHPGARGEATMPQAISTIVESVKQASKRAPMGGLRILIENTAGMGTAVGARLEEVGEILAGLRNLTVGACLDTAHLIAAEAFARILRHPRFGSAGPEGLTGRAFVAETPIDDPGDDRRNVAALWELAGLQEQAPEAEKGFSMLTPALKRKITENRKMEKKRKDNAQSRSAREFAEKKTRTKKSVTGKSKTRKSGAR